MRCYGCSPEVVLCRQLNPPAVKLVTECTPRHLKQQCKDYEDSQVTSLEAATFQSDSISSCSPLGLGNARQMRSPSFDTHLGLKAILRKSYATTRRIICPSTWNK
ncbi:hypothetical protein CIB48_g9000 [Xylaria polymorpha]|nr:hypothetical protein CIB48_g9000 [Xylaria polymorpha]